MTELHFENLRPRDFNLAARFGAEGMHFNKFSDHPLIVTLSGRIFLSMCLEKSTQVIAAYEGDKLAGILTAAVHGEKPCCRRWRHKAYLALSLLAHVLPGMSRGPAVYGEAMHTLIMRYRGDAPAGEISYLAADPSRLGQGIGSALLAELARRESGKRLMLFTDDSCSYGFYDHMGLERVGTYRTDVGSAGKPRPLTCMLYMKTFD